MPCSTCGHPLLVNHKQQDLRCPQCLNLDLADRNKLVNKVERDRQRLHDDRVKTLLYEYSKDHLLLYLIERLNVVSHHFYENRRLNQKEFAYLNHLIKLIYPEDRSNFEDKYLERGDELDETIDALIDAQAEVINALNHIEDRFRLCVKYEVPMPDQKYLFSDYNIYDSEYRYCYQRCLRSLISGRPEDVELFDKTDETLRDFDILEADEIVTLEDYAYTFFEFIISLLFVASADEVVGDIYTTFPPDYVTIFDIQDLLDEIDSQFTDEEGNVILQDSTLGWTNREGLNAAGEAVFDNEWSEVEESVLISRSNLEAHPFLFQIPVQKVLKKPSGRPPITRERTRIVYPRWYARLLQYQIFPLLKNGEKDSGHEILNKVGRDRGERFERLVYEYLSDHGFVCFYSAEIPGVDSSEIDVLAVDEEQQDVWFIECKYMLPETDMNTADGIERLNEKFDYKVFNVPGAYPGTPSGQPFPDKVEEWLALEPETQFRWQKEAEGNNITKDNFQEEWQDFNIRMLVVSNLTPSYVEKNDVAFRTDMELIEMVEGEDPVYKVSH